MSAHDTPLSLIGYAVLKAGMKTNPSFRPDQPSVFTFDNLKIQNALKKEPDEQNPAWIVSLAIELAPKPEDNMPYELDIQMIGFFSVAEGCSAGFAKELVVVNGSSILFGTAREFLRTLTSSGPHPSIVLPTVSFAPINNTQATVPPSDTVEESKGDVSEDSILESTGK